MYNLLSGLERFGLEASVENITVEEVKVEAKAGEESVSEGPKETDYLFLKSFECPICDAKLKFPVLKSGRARRMEPDVDLRAKCENIDPYKYDTVSCPKCGFTSMQRYFGHLLPTQKKAIKEQLCQRLQIFPINEFTELREIDYDTAIELYKLHGKKPVLCAPTGRAAKRMTETTGEEAKTLHRLLEIGKVEEEGRIASVDYDVAPLDADVVIVDEVSMVDVNIFYHLLN